MKKVLGLAALAVITTAAQAEMAMPTIYGKVTKNYMQVSQDTKGLKSTSGVVDTANSESRLGAKGSYDLGNDMTAKYTLEVGLNSTSLEDESTTSKSKTSGRIRMRLAKIDLVSNFGTLTVGQDYTADSKSMLAIDTFSGTVASGVGADYAAYVDGTEKGIGFNYRSRKDLVKFATPVFAGVQYVVSADKNDKSSNDPSSTNYDATYMTHLLSYDRKTDSMAVRLQTSYTTWAEAANGDNTNLHVGYVLGFSNLTMKAGWSKEENKALLNVATESDETTKMTVGFTYKMGDHTARVAYYNAKLEETRAAGNTTKEDSQISAGYEYGFNKYVSMNTIVSMLEHEETTTANNNDATVVSVGAVVKF